MAEFFTEVSERIPYEGPDSDNPLAFHVVRRRPRRRRAADGGPPPVCRLLLALLQLGRLRHLRHRDARPPLASDVCPDGRPTRGGPAEDGCRLRVLRQARGALLLLPRPRHRAGGRDRSRSRRRCSTRWPTAPASTRSAPASQLLWGTANLFSNPRYQAGAATNPDPEVFAYAAAQVAHCLEATHRLGGHNYVLWGGREGYDTLLNTDLRRELDQLARFLSMVVEHKYRIGFAGTILIEPKPFEPTKHQYDFDVAAVHAFLQRYDLVDEIKVNIEVNHATLSGHEFAHEVAAAVAAGIFGSVDANAGDDRLGWDVDRFPVSVEQMMLGDARDPARRRVHAPAASTSTRSCADSRSTGPTCSTATSAGWTRWRGRCSSPRRCRDELDANRDARYAGWDGDLGRSILDGTSTLSTLHERAFDRGEPARVSGGQERLENLVARHVARVADRVIDARRRRRLLHHGDQGRGPRARQRAGRRPRLVTASADAAAALGAAAGGVVDGVRVGVAASRRAGGRGDQRGRAAAWDGGRSTSTARSSGPPSCGTTPSRRRTRRG